MSTRVALQPDPLSAWAERYTPEMLRHLGVRVEALLSRHNNLEMYKRSIERQLALMAAQIHAEDVLLLPASVFLLVELRGSGGVSAPLEQIARLLREVGYWKSPVHVQNYYRQDVYHLGKSAQRLFDDYAALDERVKQFQAQLGSIKEHRHVKPEATPHEAFEGLATAMGEADAQALVDAAVVAVLEQPTTAERFKWPFVTLSILLQRAVKRKVTHHL